MSLKTNNIFQNLSDSDINYIYNNAKILTLNLGNFLFYQGDKAEHFYILLSGEIKIYKTNLKLKEIVIHRFIESGTVIAEMPFFQEIEYPATAVVESEHVSILSFSRQNFRRISEKYPSILYKCIESMGNKVKILDLKVENIAMLSSEERVAKYILENWQEFKNSKKKDIASDLNMTPEHLSRVLNSLKKLGIELDIKNELLSEKNKQILISFAQ